MTTTKYTPGFFQSFQAGSRSSAERVVPLVLDLVPAQSVVDVGCGIGTWLSVLQEKGVPTLQGLDGPWVDPKQLMVSADQFKTVDLSRPVNLGGKTFDLAISMEVAEHLPDRASEQFVDTLTSLAPVILFSAALPGQGGIDHINEQWPAYWIERFARRGYTPIDCLRKKIWMDPNVEWWYSQNALIFANQQGFEKFPKLREALAAAPKEVLPIVHPACLAVHTSGYVPLRVIVKAFPTAFKDVVVRRLGIK